jgi:hypothetical protein
MNRTYRRKLMSRNREFRKIVLCVGLEMAALMGAPLRPEELAGMFRGKRQAGIESSVRKDSEDPGTSPGPGLKQRVSARHIADHGELLS